MILPGIDKHRQDLRIAELIDQTDANTSVVAYGHIDPSLIFYGNRNIPKYGDSIALHTFLSQPDAILLTTDSRLRDIADVVPSHAMVLAEVPRFFRQDKWVLVGQSTMVSKRPFQQATRH